MQQQTTKPSKLQSFVSLRWYDGLIEFLFRFVAKTSEPLLAAGIVYSAADILSKGHLSSNTPMVSDAWALTQALAIESSGGVVLVYGLTSLKERDKVKAWLYLILSGLLAIAGGIMLFMQLAGWSSQGNSPFMLGLFVLRCVVSVGYIYLCRTKHIRFADLAEPSVSAPVHPHFTRDDLKAVVAEVLNESTLLIPERSSIVDGTDIADMGTVPELAVLRAPEPGVRITLAHDSLVAQGRKITIDALQGLAHVRRQTVVDWMKTNNVREEGAA